MPSQANLWLGSPKRLSPALSHVRHDLLPHLYQYMALINSLQSFCPLAASGKCNADPPYAQSIINFKGKSIPDFYPRALAQLEVIEEEKGTCLE